MTGKTYLLWANILYAAVRFILGGMFFNAGILKLNSPQDFAIIVSEFGLVSESTLMPVAVLLLVEVLAVSGLSVIFRMHRAPLRSFCYLPPVKLVRLGEIKIFTDKQGIQ